LSEVGIADALICRQLPKGKLEVIDGHLRREAGPDVQWPVLVLDVTKEEADKLLVSLDPLAAMATADIEKFDALRGLITSDSLALNAMWDEQRLAGLAGLPGGNPGAGEKGDPAKLADRFLLVPFSVLSARDGWWQERKRAWIALGIQSDLGRGEASPPGGSPMPARSKENPNKFVRGDSRARPIETRGGPNDRRRPAKPKNDPEADR
jgi:hypothetical protein